MELQQEIPRSSYECKVEISPWAGPSSAEPMTGNDSQSYGITEAGNHGLGLKLKS